MNFLKGFKNVAGAFKGLGGAAAKPAASGAASSMSQLAKDRSALKAGAKYVDIGTPNQNFNASGFLKGTKAPKSY